MGIPEGFIEGQYQSRYDENYYDKDNDDEDNDGYGANGVAVKLTVEFPGQYADQVKKAVIRALTWEFNFTSTYLAELWGENGVWLPLSLERVGPVLEHALATGRGKAVTPDPTIEDFMADFHRRAQESAEARRRA